ncbi:ion channel [Microbacterium sp.]|uniref:potassium channel family protein n=2 Tax=unclassified Microbacterium TaxID=2609290 RepID=UPI0026D89349|tara:strand:+ start:9178 stop:9906 length:729 start_codon:yes stop_codon:yes gene_type:complete
MYGTRLARWEKAMEWPLLAAAIIFLVAYALEITADLRGANGLAANAVIWVAWAAFAIDYIVRLAIAKNRWRWFYRHLLDLAIVVLPMLRPLRLMRFLTILAIFQRGAGNLLRGQVVIYTFGATLLAILVAALAVLDAEQAEGTITSFGDAAWWAFVTITTVGYGDYFPVTLAGRLVAVGLMVGGIALIGVVTATLASWIVERVSDRSDADELAAAASEYQVEELRREVAELKDMIRALQTHS